MTETVTETEPTIPDEFQPLLSEVLGMGRRLADYPSLAGNVIIKQAIENAFQAVGRARSLLEKQIIADKIFDQEQAIIKAKKTIEDLKDQEKNW